MVLARMAYREGLVVDCMQVKEGNWNGVLRLQKTARRAG